MSSRWRFISMLRERGEHGEWSMIYRAKHHSSSPIHIPGGWRPRGSRCIGIIAGTGDIRRHRLVIADIPPSSSFGTAVIQVWCRTNQRTLASHSSLLFVRLYQSITAMLRQKNTTLETADYHPQPWRHLSKTGRQAFFVTAAVHEKREKSPEREGKNLSARTCLQMEALAVISYLQKVTQESVVDRVCQFADFVYELVQLTAECHYNFCKEAWYAGFACLFNVGPDTLHT